MTFHVALGSHDDPDARRVDLELLQLGLGLGLQVVGQLGVGRRLHIDARLDLTLCHALRPVSMAG